MGALKVTPGQLQATMLTNPVLSGSTASVHYDVPAGYGIKPNMFGHAIAAWKGMDLDTSAAPAFYWTVTHNDVHNNTSVNDVSIFEDDYILGYSLTGGPNINIAATIAISRDGTEPRQQSIDLKLSSTGDTYNASYVVPTHVHPKACGHWLAVWEDGALDTFAIVAPIAQVSSSGNVVLDVELRRDTNYVLGYFVSGLNQDGQPEANSQKYLAAVLPFTTD